MHTTNADISIEELTKIEGTAACEIKIRDGAVTECHFGITEMRRFYTQAVRGKPVEGIPQQVARICGTCSNAHLLASVKAIENALGVEVSEQTKLLRQLLYWGLTIRDHGLHLYVFVLPDIYGRNSILAFDENNPEEHELIHDTFAVKEAGNRLAIVSAGRSVHAPFVRLGGFTSVPEKEKLTDLIPRLVETRGKILKLISIFAKSKFELRQDLRFLALCDENFSFLNGVMKDSDGRSFSDDEFFAKLERTDIPYSHATGYTFDGKIHMVGALARLNLNKDALHESTRRDAAEALTMFPSDNVFHNNLAQAIEMLHAVDSSLDAIRQYEGKKEEVSKITYKNASGIGLIEAPRGTLYHRYEINENGTIKNSSIVVPTGQNQIGIERSIRTYVEKNVDKPKEELTRNIEGIVRAYDPCMSCATHFLKMKWS
jgi:sulfhydrogenase subunit alpha